MRSQVEATAKTIESQARKLGYAVESQGAATGTIYLTVSHDRLDGDRLIRVADHEPNEARYVGRISVNQEPDLFVDAGMQAEAVRRLVEWIGGDVATVAYLRAAETRKAKKAAVTAERVSRQEQERVDFVTEMKRRYESCSDEDRRKADHYATLHGKTRKAYRQRHADALRRAGAMA